MEIDWTNVGVALTSLAIGGGGAFLKFRRANSRESVDQAHDKAERNLISRLESERDEAREEAKRERDQRLADAVRIAHLESDNEDLQRYVRRLLRTMPQEQREVYETDFAPMCTLPPEKK